MTNDSSLLAHLSSRFTERTEDIAVEALGYVLSTSEAAKKGLLSILRSGGADVEELPRIDTQVSGKEGERPDLVGWDESGDERLLIEAKFWAGLTDNQPNAYLKSLPRSGVLLFVAPETRLDALWPELEQRAKQEFEWTAAAGNARTADANGRRLMLTSWRALLDEVERRAAADGDTAAVNSIQQLNGLCEQQDEGAFVPLRPGELGPDLPRRLMNLHTTINRAFAKAKAKGLLEPTGGAPSPNQDGYGRWLELGVLEEGAWANGKRAGARLCVHYTAWSRHEETPIWLEFADAEKRWNVLPLKKVRKRLRDDMVSLGDGTHLVPIHLPTGVEIDHVVDSVVDQLRNIAHRIAGVASD
jgi:hypothetical protein